MAALSRTTAQPASAIIDVGGGASSLTDRLLDRGLQDITILDVAATALDVSQARLDPRAAQEQ